MIQPVVKPVVKPVVTTSLTTGLTTGWMFVYTIQPVVKPVWQPAVSCKRVLKNILDRIWQTMSQLKVNLSKPVHFHKRWKLSVSSSTPYNEVFLTCPMCLTSTSIITTFEPISIILTFDISRTFQSILPNHQTDWFQCQQFSKFGSFLSFQHFDTVGWVLEITSSL